MSDAIAPELTQARLALVAASQVGLQIALRLLGVSARRRCNRASAARRLLPDSAEVIDGVLHIGDCNTLELAQEFGTGFRLRRAASP